MYERLGLVFLVASFLGVASLLMKLRQVTLSVRASKPLAKGEQAPSIVYFWSEACSVCKKTQRPILEEIIAEYGADRLLLAAYNVEESADIARMWGVRTLPTTFLLDSSGVPRHIHNGLVQSATLRKQLSQIVSLPVGSE
jgi:thioredoxin-like negative regulator of GroEL